MRILYGIQGTGNGHISRAMEILPQLQKRGEVDVLISGHQSELKLPVEVRYAMHGLGFVFGRKGGIDLVETYRKSRLRKFYREVHELAVDQNDMVISDFEPVTAWACLQKNRNCIGLSNQVSLLSPKVPKAGREDFVGRFVVRNYAPCAINFGLSYKRYDDRIYTPIIRKGIRLMQVESGNHVVVYLPAYSDERIIESLSIFSNVEFRVFSKTATRIAERGNAVLFPLEKERFEINVATCAGIITAAGFGSTSEALFLGKKLLVIPQKLQYEQACNAEALRQMGVRVVQSLKPKHRDKIEHWLMSEVPVQVAYPDITEDLINDIFYAHHTEQDPYHEHLVQQQYLGMSSKV